MCRDKAAAIEINTVVAVAGAAIVSALPGEGNCAVAGRLNGAAECVYAVIGAASIGATLAFHGNVPATCIDQR